MSRVRIATIPAGRPFVPLLIALVVLSLVSTLAAIAVRSPYTHSNLGVYDRGYTRTEQAVVGPAELYRGEGVAPIRYPDEATRGAALWVSKGCVGCHSLTGRGGVIGPDMAGFDAAWLREKTREGPNGMPAYAEGALSDKDLEAIVAYLQAINAGHR